jgi:tagaturonate epimerase
MKHEWESVAIQLIQSGYTCSIEKKEGGLYPNSLLVSADAALFLAYSGTGKNLIILQRNESSLFTDIVAVETGEIISVPYKIAELSHVNAVTMRRYFPFMKPVPFGRQSFSMGLGDRLGLASPGHLRCLKGTGIRPVLAQQSIRELMLTERTYEDVLDAASWAVLQEGFREGFGADGDHLKKPEEVKMAVELGYSMITLDCSEKIDNTVSSLGAPEIAEKYNKLESTQKQEMEAEYLGKTFLVGNVPIKFNTESLQRTVLTYGATLAFIKEIHTAFIASRAAEIDFELSIDETETPTTAEAHYFMAAEMKKAGIELTSVAPRFCGEFQKAIDYIGDLTKFEAEFVVHTAIADHFGYRLSIHSGSDKFKVFPIIGHYTGGRVHVKTAGTNWLEALRVVCRVDPDFFRRICAHASSRFSDATKFYHVTTDLKKIPDAETLPDTELERMLNEEDARQLLHITYGYILTDKDPQGAPLFRDRLYRIWHENEDVYADVLIKHIGHHVEMLKSRMGEKKTVGRL